MDNSRILQRNGRLTGIPSCGCIPRYNSCHGTCRPENKECRCTEKNECRDDNVCTCNEKCTNLAIASVKMQKWCDIYDMEKGYCRGTIFSQLDLPFCGMKGGRLC